MIKTNSALAWKSLNPITYSVITQEKNTVKQLTEQTYWSHSNAYKLSTVWPDKQILAGSIACRQTLNHDFKPW